MEDELIRLLQTANAAHSAADQRALTLSLAKFNAQQNAPVVYLSLFSSPSLEGSLRGMAGLLLKNLLKRRDCLESFYDQAIEKVLAIMSDHLQENFVASTAATILAVIVVRDKRRWSNVLYVLLRHVTGANHVSTIEHCLVGVERVLEEVGTGLSGMADHHSLAHVLQTLLSPVTQTATVSIKILSLKSLGHLLSIDPDAIDLNSLLSSLSHCAVSDHADIKRLTCVCLSMLCDVVSDERMAPSKPAISSFMLRALCDVDEQVTLEACEYWHAVAEKGHEMDSNGNEEVVKRLLPLLISRVVYPEDDPEALCVAVDDHGTHSGGGQKPLHHKSKRFEPDQQPDDVENDDDDQVDYTEWTIRKCAASTIDLFASSLDTKLFLSIVLPCCQQLLNSENYLEKEAAILILGAIAEGCIEQMEEHLNVIVPFLIGSLQHEQPLVRSISAWTVARYHLYIAKYPDLLHRVILTLSELMGDRFLKVRKAACSAIAVVAESHELPRQLLATVYGKVSLALPLYTANTLTNLFDLVSILSLHQNSNNIIPDSIPNGLAARYVHSEVVNCDNTLFPLLEALCALVVSCDEKVVCGIAPLLSTHSISFIERILRECQDESRHEIDTECAAAALDLLGAIVRGVQYIDGSLLHVLFNCSADSVLLQSALAVLGDIAMCYPSALGNTLGPTATLLLEHFDPCQLTSDVARNAVWAWGNLMKSRLVDGEMMLKGARELCRCFLLPNQSRSFYDNVVVALGETLLLLANRTGNDLDIQPIICRYSRLLSANTNQEERERAGNGLLSFICSQLPQAISKCPAEIVRIAVATGSNSPPAVSIIDAVKKKVVGMEGWEQWRSQYLSDIPLNRL